MDHTDAAGLAPENNAPEADDSVRTLIARAAVQACELVRDESRLAKEEVSATGRRLKAGAGLFAGSALLGLLALQALTVAAITGLADEPSVSAWALTVCGVLLATGVVLAETARRKVKAAGPLMPVRTIESVKADLAQIRCEVRR